MKLTKCEKKGHFYDADKYDSCPHCGTSASTEKGSEQISSEKPGIERPSASPPKRNTLSPHTGSIWEQERNRKTASLFQSADEQVQNMNSAEQNHSLEMELEPETNPEPESAPFAETPKLSSLQSAVNAVVSNSPAVDVKTMAFYNLAETEPITGWLVCVKGSYLGQSFSLKTGRNNIGRAMNMDIPLAQETSVSRNKHAVLTFDPQKQMFYIQPGESNGLTYLNNELVMTFVPIQAYDKIQIGNSEFVFVPFCGEKFTWDDYIK